MVGKSISLAIRTLRKASPWWELRGAKEVWLFMVEMGGIGSKREICDGPRSNVENMAKEIRP